MDSGSGELSTGKGGRGVCSFETENENGAGGVLVDMLVTMLVAPIPFGLPC